MRIFGRDSSRSHARLGDICEEILSDPQSNPDDRQFAWNLLHDSRVNPDWAEYWYLEYGAPISPDGLRTALNGYHNDLRERPLSAYTELEMRGRNFVRANTPEGPADNDLLVHILDLWSPGARHIWNHARRQEMAILAGASDLGLERPTPPAIITGALETGTIAGQRPIMTTFFEALQDYLKEVENAPRRNTVMATLNPYWVARWERWIARIRGSAGDWCESVGLSKPPGRWIAVVRYSVNRIDHLIRPTQLEAHWYGRHFPTPPLCRTPHGGRVVEGRPVVFSDRTRFALPEYVHAPIPLYVSDWLDCGFAVLRTAIPTGPQEDLARDRTAHWSALAREFPDTQGWMPRPNG